MKKTWVNVPDVLFFQEGPGVRNTQYTSDGVKLLNVANLIDGNIDLSKSDRYISEEEAYEKYKHFLCDEGDFIVASSGIKVEYIDKKMGFVENTMLPLCMNTSTIRFKSLDQEKLRIRYFMYYLKSNHFKRQLFKQITGSAQLNYGPSHLKKMVVPLTDIEKQDRIIAELDRIQNIINEYEKELMLLDKLIKARFVELFGSEQEFDRWPCCNIGDVADVCVGVVIKPTQFYTEDGIPAFRSLNIGEMKVKDNDWVYFTDEGHKKNQKSVVRTNDVLVVRSGAPGTACVATEKYNGYNAVDIIIAHPDQDKVNSVFLAAFTNMPHGMNQIKGGTGGAAQQHFNVGGYKSMILIMPPIELQQQFADFVTQVDKSKAAVQKALDETQLLFDSLMQEYFG